MDSCIPWTGRINEFGYGTIGIHLAHRRVWQQERGEIPEGYTLDHMCHDPNVCRLGRQCPHRRCVNVNHLEVVTPQENKDRGSLGWYNTDKTHCKKGHPYAGANLLISGGRRHCRTCRREALRERRAIAKDAACLKRGHDRQSAISVDGKDYCVICNRAASKLGTETQWGRRAA